MYCNLTFASIPVEFCVPEKKVMAYNRCQCKARSTSQRFHPRTLASIARVRNNRHLILVLRGVAQVPLFSCQGPHIYEWDERFK